MICPGTNRLVEFMREVNVDAELAAHLAVCSSCKAELALLREVSAELRPEYEVPDRLVRRVMADIDLPEPSPERNRIPISQVVGSGVLGAIMAVGAIIVTDSVGVGDPIKLLLFSVVVGIGASLLQIRGGRRSNLGET